MTSVIPYGRQDITQQDIDAVTEVLRSEFLTQGPAVSRFEEAVAFYSEARFAVATNSATSALHLACMSLEVGPGDRVWTSAITFVASANCARYCGAMVDFIDIDPRTYNMSVARLSEKLEGAKLKDCLPKVVIPVHLCGQPCDMRGIYELSQIYGFRIIEDASHAIGGRYQNERIGNSRYSDITVFSFHPVKIITTAEGGIALTNDKFLHRRMKQIRSHGITTDPAEMQPRPDSQIWNYQQICLGYNYRMTDLQAALGLSQLERLQAYVERRHRIADRYCEELSNLPIQLPWQNPDSYSSFHLYPIRIKVSDCGVSQQQLFDVLKSANINVNLHYIPVYLQPYYESMGFKTGYCPEAEDYFHQALSIPMYPTLSDIEQGKVIETLTKALA
jgi:UDP-4-amino-4,6-dideoxy-N-acetyl-beta-L-altrosamine transaminase